MNLQEHLLKLSEYNIGLNIYEKNFVIQIYYPNGWIITKPEVKDIIFTQDKNDSNLYYYIAPVSVNINSILDIIYDVINYNKELEEKVTLFKSKIEELKIIFDKERLSVLKTLEFRMKKKKERKNNNTENIISENETLEQTDIIDNNEVKDIE